MMTVASITIAEIRSILTLALDAVEERHGSTMSFSEDYYWHLPVESAFDMSLAHPHVTAGQVSDDIAELRASLTRPDEAEIVTWHELNHVIGVLRVIELRSLP